MARNSIVMFRAYMEAAEALAEDSKEVAYDYLHAILKYALDEEEPELRGSAKSAFMLTKLPLDTSIRRSESGKTGGESGKSSSKSQANLKQNASAPKANAKQTESKTEADRKPTESTTETKLEIRNKKLEISNQKGETPPIPPTGVEDWGDPFPDEPLPPKEPNVYEERFERFWSAYPRKVGKGECRRIWLKLKPSEELTQTMLSAVEAAKGCDQWRRDGGQYIPYPSTWLNQGRWEDSPQEEGDQPVDYSQFTDADWLAV